MKKTKFQQKFSANYKKYRNKYQLPLWNKVLSFLVGASTSICVYLTFFQRHIVSKRFVLYALLIGIPAGFASCLVTKKIIAPIIKRLDKQLRIFSIFSAVVFAVIVLVNISVPPVYNLIPETDLDINLSVIETTYNDEPLRLLWIKNRQGYIHFSNLEIYGDLEYDGKHLLFPSGQDVGIHWRGAVGPYTEIAFREPARTQEIVVEWGDEKPVSFSLNSADSSIEYEEQLDGTTNVIIPLHTPVAFVLYLPFILAFIFAGGFAILSIMLLLVNMPLTKKKQDHKNRHWLLYSLPMIFIWTFILMVFWPGILTNDGLGQWTQAETGIYNNWQSTIYSLLIWVLMRIWHTPAVVALLQIISLAVVVAYGLLLFEKQGIRPIITAIIHTYLRILMIFFRFTAVPS